jgi:hypothetical protein
MTDMSERLRLLGSIDWDEFSNVELLRLARALFEWSSGSPDDWDEARALGLYLVLVELAARAGELVRVVGVVESANEVPEQRGGV